MKGIFLEGGFLCFALWGGMMGVILCWFVCFLVILCSVCSLNQNFVVFVFGFFPLLLCLSASIDLICTFNVFWCLSLLFVCTLFVSIICDMYWLYQPKVPTLKFVLVRVVSCN